MQYKIGQTLILKHETEIETELGRKIKVPAGNKIIIGADKMAHHLTNGMIQPVSKDIEIKGYDAYGLAKYLLTHIKNWCPIDEFFEHYGIDENEFAEELEFALDEIGF